MHRLALAVALLTTAAHAQWTLQDSHTTASFRGVDNVGNGVVWVSGTEGTVLHTTDNGKTWQHCSTPPNAEKLDFRGIQAFDAKTAVVMSSGPGDASRLYRTTDACKTWSLVFMDPDVNGFFDALVDTTGSPQDRAHKSPGGSAYLLLGDPIAERFPIRTIVAGYAQPNNFTQTVPAKHGEAVFAASNSSLLALGNTFVFATGGKDGSRVIRTRTFAITDETGWTTYPSVVVPVGSKSATSGIFSIATSDLSHLSKAAMVAVGGDYQAPNTSQRIAATSSDGGKHWRPSITQPHGYRSAVAYDATLKIWITAGPNGTDISTDDGRNWHALKPGPHDPPDADKNWNALSLPFVVGPRGRIGILRDDALPASNSK